MPADSFERTYSVTRVRAVTLNADAAINGVYPRAIYLGAAGDITLIAAEDTAAVTLVGLAAGVWHPLAFAKVTSIGAASGVLAGY